MTQIGQRPLNPLETHSRFSVAIRTMRAARSVAARGRPGARRALPSYFSAVSLRCHRSRVSGVTMVAIIGKHLSRQGFGPHRQATPLIVIEPQRSPPELFAENSVYLSQVVDDLLLLMIHPSSHGDQQQPKRIERLWHLRSLASETPSAISNLFKQIEFLTVRDHASPHRV